MARKHPVLIAAALLILGAGAAGAALPLKSSNPAPALASGCARSVSGQGFHVYSCMSGGANAGHPHPKELLVIRNDGSSAAYPVFRTVELGAGGGKVVATYDLSVVRVTSNRLVPLLTSGELARVLHVGSTAIVDIHDPRVDARGDVYFIASVLRPRRSGCRNLFLERTSGGTVRQIRASTTPNTICS